MLFTQALLKFSSIGIALALIALILRDGRHIRALQFGVPLLLSVICLFLTTGEPEISITGKLGIALRLFDMLSFIFVWWFGLALFDDEFRLGPKQWLIAFIYVALHLPGRLYFLGFDVPWTEGLEIAVSALSIVLMLHLMYIALSGHREDLVESRRKMRKYFAGALVAMIVITILMERFTKLLDIDPFLPMLTIYLFTLPLTLWAVLWVTQLHPEKLAFPARQKFDAPTTDPRDELARERLKEIMEVENAYAEHGLSIGKLSTQIGLPPHQLRSLINQSMGYRNYSAFLNSYRIKAVKVALAEPENARTPILTLAINAGFSSLAPFNKAFKDSEGMTPTDYRNTKLAQNQHS